jgi:hypothetical protein
MANFGLGGSPAFSTFRANFGLGQTAFSDIIARVWPNNDSFYDISAMSTYRNQSLFRYNINSNNSSFGNVQLLYPFVSARTSSVLTPWFRVGNPPYITVQAFAFYPRSFQGWRTGDFNTIFVNGNNPANIGWNDSGFINITAIFA